MDGTQKQIELFVKSKFYRKKRSLKKNYSLFTFIVFNGFNKKEIPITIIKKEIICAPEKISKKYFSFVRINSIENRSIPAKIK